MDSFAADEAFEVTVFDLDGGLGGAVGVETHLDLARLGGVFPPPPQHSTPLVPPHPPPPPLQGPAVAGEPREARIGFQFRYEGGKTIVGNVLAGTPAWRAGVAAGDEIVALDGLRVDAMSLGTRMQEKAPGSTAQLTVFRRDELMTLQVPVEFGPPQRLVLRPVDAPSPEQRQLLEHWLRQDPPASPAG